MLHRHLNVTSYSLPVIDDIISRGKLADWIALREAIENDSSLLDKVEQICRHYISDPHCQRYFLWMHYVEEQREVA